MKKLVKEYTQFRENYNFKFKELTKIDNAIYLDDELVEDENSKTAETDKFINTGYNLKNSLSRGLSNLYPMKFKFKGKTVASIESVLQGIKYRDKKLQNIILKYSGLDAYHTRGANTLDFWGNTGKLYWQGKEIDRKSNNYQLFIDELYISVSKNPLYKKLLLSTPDKYLLHHIGNSNIDETVLTRYEYELRLNSLREFLRLKDSK